MQASKSDRFLGFELKSDGTLNHCLQLAYNAQPQEIVKGVNVARGNFQPIRMNGKEIYRFAVQKVPEVIEKALFRANLSTEQVNWLILHQANQRILDAVAERLNIPTEKVLSNLAHFRSFNSHCSR
jgi:3-oxoacyl-[acyl-carrier-protein] synthase III